MGLKDDKSCLGYLGAAYQYNLVKSFIEDKEFFKSLNEIIDQNAFTEPVLKHIVAIMRNHYNKYGSVPGYDLIGIELRDSAHTEHDREVNMAVLERMRNTTLEAPDLIMSKGEKFFKQQNLVKAANTILQIAGNGDASKYDECKDILDAALKAGRRDRRLYRVFDDYEDTLAADYRSPIPTGIGKLDETLEGGLGAGELACIIGPSGFGKAQPVSELVATPNGWSRMGDIKVGDYVIGSDGRPTKVIGVFPQGVRPIYRVEFSDGVSCRCDEEHLWNVNSHYQRFGKKYVSGLSKSRDDKYVVRDESYKTLSLKDIIAKGLILGGKHKHYNFRVPMPKPVNYAEKHVLINPYLLGYFIGDGCQSRKAITVGHKDEEIVVHLLKQYGGREFSINHHKDRATTLGFRSDFEKDLSVYYTCNHTAENKFIPDDYKYNSLENRILLLNGLMDSDGTCIKNGTSAYNTKSKRLAEDVRELVLSLGGYVTVAEKKCGYFNKKYNRYVDCGIQYEVRFTLCDSSIPVFQLGRKQERVNYRTKYANNRFIKAVTKIGEEEAQCIKVDAEDELYLTRDYIVTHNTTVTTAIASTAATTLTEANNYKGYKVLQVVFEDNPKQMRRKHLSRISQTEARCLSHEDCIEHVRELTNPTLQNNKYIQDNIIIAKYASGENTVGDIANLVKELTNEGFKPDVLILDYFECLKLERGFENDKWDAEGKTMRKLESITGELGLATWVTTQGTKESLNVDIVTLDKAGGSFKKVQIAHIVVSISRTLEDIDNNVAKLTILKNRAGKSGKTFDNVYFNNGTCTINTDTCTEFNSIIDYGREQKQSKEAMAAEIFKNAKAQRQASRQIGAREDEEF